MLLGLHTGCAGGAGGADPELVEAIARIEAGELTTPLVAQPSPGSEATLTFLVKGEGAGAPRIVSDVTGWGERVEDESFDLGVGAMAPVGSTGWFRLDIRVAPRSRVEYLVVHGETDYRTDPHNPRRAWSVSLDDPPSEVVTPDWAPPPELTDPPAVPCGRAIESTFDSRALGGPRRALVYLPPGYREDGDYPVFVFHSGWRVARHGEAPRVVDWMIAHSEIEPTVGLFLESYVPGDPDNREGPPLRTFLTEEAPAWLASRYSVTSDPEGWAVLAISYGAKDALDAALAPVRTYGRLGLLIPGRRLTPADLEAFAASRGPRLRVAILAGRYDAANLATALGAQTALVGAGHDVDLLEVPEGHNPSAWRNQLRDVLASLYGG